jgi:hypothetical protein
VKIFAANDNNVVALYDCHDFLDSSVKFEHKTSTDSYPLSTESKFSTSLSSCSVPSLLPRFLSFLL